MSNRVFVGGLSWDTDDQGLREAFERFGELTDVKVMTDRDTGRSRGFGFVSFASSDAAAEAISQMDGAQLDGRALKVDQAQERSGGGFGGGRGGRKGGW